MREVYWNLVWLCLEILAIMAAVLAYGCTKNPAWLAGAIAILAHARIDLGDLLKLLSTKREKLEKRQKGDGP